jgi:hypothetical protein
MNILIGSDKKSVISALRILHFSHSTSAKWYSGSPFLNILGLGDAPVVPHYEINNVCVFTGC